MITRFFDNIGHPVTHHLWQNHCQIEHSHKQTHFCRIHPFAHNGKDDGYNSRPADTDKEHSDIKVHFNMTKISHIKVADSRKRQGCYIGSYPSDAFCNGLQY